MLYRAPTDTSPVTEGVTLFKYYYYDYYDYYYYYYCYDYYY